MGGVWLAIDTATDIASVAVGKPPDTEAGVFVQGARRHAAELIVLIDHSLKQAGLRPQDLEGIVVGDGPGSFTGLRIGWAAAKGLAQQEGVSLAAVPSLMAAAATVARQLGPVPVAACRHGGSTARPPTARRRLLRRAAGPGLRGRLRVSPRRGGDTSGAHRHDRAGAGARRRSRGPPPCRGRRRSDAVPGRCPRVERSRAAAAGECVAERHCAALARCSSRGDAPTRRPPRGRAAVWSAG